MQNACCRGLRALVPDQHVNYLKVGLIVLAWSLLALISVAVSLTSLVLMSKQLDRRLRVIVAIANLPVLIVMAGLFFGLPCASPTSFCASPRVVRDTHRPLTADDD